MRRSAVLMLVLAFVAACSTGANNAANSPPPSPTGPSVRAEDLKFVPAKITVEQGDTVTWVMAGAVPHNVVAKDGSFESKTLPRGQTYAYTFQKAGTYKYVCTLHPQMTGSVEVASAY